MEKRIFTVSAILAGLLLAAGPLAAAGGSIYGHVTFIDKGASVLRADGGEVEATINLPLAQGDTIVTPAAGRCELQFENGTVVRLDKDSRLRLVTVLAPSLTSSWEITTLELEKGQLYALPQTYGQEMFQVVTAGAAVNLRRRAAAYIRIDAGGGASFFSDGGTLDVLFGGDVRSLKRARVKPGRPFAVAADHSRAESIERKDIEFTAWNEYVDRHFNDLHRGISKVPANFTKFKNKALLYWAEKWSSLYGEWIYDDLFGYVWRPADDRFAFSLRPFFHASFVRVDGQLFLVPQEPWGWVPAHMGTWVWMKRGWTWIPGDWFHPGIAELSGTLLFPTFDYYCHLFNANLFPWHAPRPAGEPGWPMPPQVEPKPPALPGPVVGLVKKAVKAIAAGGPRRGATGQAIPVIDRALLPPAPRPETSPAATPPARRAAGAAGTADGFALERDWNPDSRWAARSGRTIRYSSSGSAVLCPELKISSASLRGVERMIFRASGTMSQGSAPAAVSSPSTGSAGASGATGTAPSGGSHAGKGGKKDGSGREK